MRNSLDNKVIDIVSSGHTPQDIDSKRVEFSLAEFGIQ